MVVGGALVWYFVLPGEADKRNAVLKYQLERAEESTKAEQAKTKEANNTSDNLKKTLDQLLADIAKRKAAEPVAEWFVWDADKPTKVLDGLEFSLYLPPTRRGNEFSVQIDTPVLPHAFKISSSSPIGFTYKGKIYYLVVEPARTSDDDPRLRLRIFDHPPTGDR